MLASLSRWLREGPPAGLVPTRFRLPLERMTVARAYPRSPPPLAWNLAQGREATLLFGGDLALHRWEPAQDTPRVFAGLGALTASADALFLNLETQLTGLDTPAGVIGSPMRADPDAIEVLSYLRVRGVTCANNHCLDFGSDGLRESARRLESAGIAVCGVVGEGRDGGALVDVRGIRIGLLGYTDDWRVSEGDSGVVHPAPHDPASIRAAIAGMRGRADLVVAQLHWGYEWSMYPMRSHRDLARSYVEAGAHLVLCHHAHVPMGVETWRSGAIAHGLGNLYFGRPRTRHHPFVSSSFLLRVGVSRAGITDLEVVPVGTDDEGRPGPATGRQAMLLEDAVGYLSNRLDKTAYLARVEESLLLREACLLLLDVTRRYSADDWAGIRERVRFMEPPRQRLLTARLRDFGGPLAGAAALLEALRDRREDVADPKVRETLVAAGRMAARHLDRAPQKGRIP